MQIKTIWLQVDYKTLLEQKVNHFNNVFAVLHLIVFHGDYEINAKVYKVADRTVHSNIIMINMKKQ